MEDADDLERLVRKGIRRVRLEDDAHTRAHAAQQPRSTVLHTTVSHTLVSHAASPGQVPDPQRTHARNDHKQTHASTQPYTLAQPQLLNPPSSSSLVSSTRSFAKHIPSSGSSYLRLLLVLSGSAVIYFLPLIIRNTFFERDIEVGIYQYLFTLIYFLYLLESHSTFSHPSQTTTCHPHIKDCDVLTLLKMEREIHKKNMAVCMDRQYSYYHYPHFHIPLSTIVNDIDAINQELLQVELLILKLESGRIEKEYDPILGKVVSKYGVK